MLIYPLQSNEEVGEHLCQKLVKFLNSNKSEFQANLIGDLSYIDNRAACHTGIKIEDVQYHYGTFMLYYSFEWTIYNGCADMEESGEEEESLEFTVDEESGEIEFSFSDPSEFIPRNREFDL
ncbi:hypothetical protein [Rheinheimera sp.]|uniref:hypothetical protein n=1 Tax=Rheinheimera sp. TaxID=1869214 RepID=UPI003D2CAE93